MKLPPLSSLRAFEALARRGKIGDAAEELHVTRSAVSHQIKALEAYVGRALVQRGGRALALTEEGRIYAYQIRQSLAEIASSTDRIQRTSKVAGITISVVPSFATHWLVPRLPDFAASHPDVQVRLLASTNFIDFDQAQADCALRFGHGNWPNVNCEHVMDDSLLVVGSPSFLPDNRPIPPSQIMELPILDSGESWPVWMKAANCDIERSRAVLEFSDSTQMLEAARLGLGVALTRRSIAQNLLDRRELVEVSDIEVSHVSRYFLVWPVRSQQSPVVLQFLAWLRSQVQI